MARIPPRILKEKQKLDREPVEGMLIISDPNNIRHYWIKYDGPPGSPYEGGKFEVEFYHPEMYPMVPPKCHFNTRIWHPNIGPLGRICLNVLGNRWSPAYAIRGVYLSI